MRPLSCLGELPAPLIADTSVVINLNATGCAEQILRALSARLVIVDVVEAELALGRERGRADADLAQILIDSGHIGVISLGERGLDHFEDLVVGPAAETLDDGEAATLAHALESGGAAIIDERKALRICSSRFPRLTTASTLDLLGHPSVFGALGEQRLAEAVFLALRDARMRVFEFHLAWVVELIGNERASQCASLPRSARLGRTRE
jgi:predicted nucleic acid-binding protein